MSERTCDNCKFAYLEDHGWSNWTVEGTYVHCLLDLHPAAPFDRWYGEDSRLRFAERCTAFTKGSPARLDVDREEYDDLSDEHKALIEAWQSQGSGDT